MTTAQTSGLVNLVFSPQTCSFECEHLFIDKPMVLTEPAKAKARLLGLGSKLHPSNMQCMLHKDLTILKLEYISTGRETEILRFL